ncbi:MAG: hypothetical protein OXT07_13385 [bacterium]|nr:hypothetical protein [bacterium]
MTTGTGSAAKPNSTAQIDWSLNNPGWPPVSRDPPKPAVTETTATAANTDRSLRRTVTDPLACMAGKTSTGFHPALRCPRRLPNPQRPMLTS